MERKTEEWGNGPDNVPPAAKTKDYEYILVSDTKSEVLYSHDSYMTVKRTAGMIRKAGGQVTIFKAIKG